MSGKESSGLSMSKKLGLIFAYCLLALLLFVTGCDSPLNPLAGANFGAVGPAGPIGERGIVGATGKRGHVGPAGARGPVGPDAGIIHFSMMQAAVRNYAFMFYPANTGASFASAFDASSVNVSNLAYSSFLVPFDGTISDLTIRADIRATADTTPNFTFTVYSSAAALDTPAVTIGWTATALATSTGAFTVNNGEARTMVSQNLTDTVSVTAGTILVIVISGTGYNDFELQPAKFAASFRYTPNT